jgi:hypothetical protein
MLELLFIYSSVRAFSTHGRAMYLKPREPTGVTEGSNQDVGYEKFWREAIA